MNAIKIDPAYWERFLHDVVAMVKQLGIPKFISTFPCDDLHENELISVISK